MGPEMNNALDAGDEDDIPRILFLPRELERNFAALTNRVVDDFMPPSAGDPASEQIDNSFDVALMVAVRHHQDSAEATQDPEIQSLLWNQLSKDEQDGVIKSFLSLAPTCTKFAGSKLPDLVNTHRQGNTLMEYEQFPPRQKKRSLESEESGPPAKRTFAPGQARLLPEPLAARHQAPLTPAGPAAHGPEKTTPMRQAKRKARRLKSCNTKHSVRASTVVQASSPSVDLENLRFASSGFQGVVTHHADMARLNRALESGKAVSVLRSFKLVPFLPQGQRPMRILDVNGRLFIYRTDRPQWMKATLPRLSQEVQALVANTSVSDKARMANSRGNHYFNIMGVDCNSKKRPAMSKWHMEHMEAVNEFYRPGSAIRRITEWVSGVLRQQFTGITGRLEGIIGRNKRLYDVDCQFGLFYNLCVNAPLPDKGVRDVICKAHCDSKNGAVLVCAVLVYYYGEACPQADECIWLVMWEAGLIIQVPAGVLVLYPSALLLHFNFDISKLELVVTSKNEKPTKANSRNIATGNSSRGGRGSIVWFTQASMLRSGELPCATLKESLAAEARLQNECPRVEPYYVCSYNVAHNLARGMFPSNI